ncbi:MAG: LacI family DNA-binding transcriptional regulator [Verrucomicrobia bacterium]|nr:LacI family DNA-binding transcriptional regulator [Verrucomicrobiota bacterium]MDA1069169.1 LacI family DNA-binding transcriptional regulator [Verrucomicrobiota bacterium]
MNPPSRIRLKDIAKEAGLSVSAVSMALKNDASMSPKTIERVKLLARKMGYTPDPALSALSAYRSKLRIKNQFSVIGLVTNWNKRDSWSGKANQKEVIRGAEERALQLGYSLQPFWAREDGVSPKRFSQILRARGIRGLILAPFENNDDILDLEWKHFSVVTISRPSQYTLFHHVVQNHYMDMLKCWEKLSERGYSRVGLVVQKEIDVRWSNQWDAAHIFSQQQSGKPEDAIPILRVEGDDDLEAIRSWLCAHRPEVVISRCHHFLEAVRLEGLRIPEDIAYISLNVNEDIENSTGIRHRRDMLGAMAVDVLNSLLQRNHKGPDDVSLGTQVDGIWVEGNTLPSRLEVF